MGRPEIKGITYGDYLRDKEDKSRNESNDFVAFVWRIRRFGADVYSQRGEERFEVSPKSLAEVISDVKLIEPDDFDQKAPVFNYELKGVVRLMGKEGEAEFFRRKDYEINLSDKSGVIVTEKTLEVYGDSGLRELSRIVYAGVTEIGVIDGARLKFTAKSVDSF